jgi:phosphatidylinositol alpha-1,6-mannosyltransferase
MPAAQLRILGDGPQAASLRRRATGLSGVQVLPAVAHDRMPEFFQGGSVFVSPVRTRLAGLYAEGLGVVACEAAASGLPVVVGDSGGAPETVVDGVTGTVVDATDPVQLASALVRWLTDPQAARVAGLAGRSHVTDLVGADRVAERLRAMLNVTA